MRKLQNYLTLALTIILIISLCACSSSNVSSNVSDGNSAKTSENTQQNNQSKEDGEKPKIVVSCYPTDDEGTLRRKEYYEDPLQEAFQQYDISVEVFSDRQSLQVQVAGGGGPDILDLDGISDVVEFAKADRVIPLDDYASEYGWNDLFYDWAYNSCYYEGKLFSLPTGFEGMVMFYNMDVFNENGYEIPKNVTELEELMADMQSKGIIPIAFGNANYQGAVDWLYSTFLSCNSGPEALKSALLGETPWTDDIIKNSIDQMVDWWQKGYIGDKASQSVTTDDMVAFFAQGKAAMMIDGTWVASQLIGTYPDCNWDCDLMPELRDGVGQVIPIATAGCKAINANSKNQDACAEILNWLFTSWDRHYESIVVANYQPYPLKEFDVSRLKDMDERLYRMYQILDEAQKSGDVGYCAWTFYPADVRIYMNENTDALFLGGLSVEEYLKEVQGYVDAAIADGTAPPVP
jgi:raffinose/stachyose/melibiose transport system substrate-binding protein